MAGEPHSKLVAFQWTQDGAGNSTERSGTITATDLSLGSASAVDLSIPEFLGAPWLAEQFWAEQPRRELRCDCVRVVVLGWRFYNPLVEGTAIRSALISGSAFAP